jgi:diguanylate cyclase (GGDEF)-like protein
LVWLLAAGLVGLVAVADWWSPADVAASLGYLLPIALAAWARGRRAAAVVAVASALAWLLVALSAPARATSTSVAAVNFSVLLVVFWCFGQVLARLRRRLEREQWLARTDPLTGVHNRRAFWNATARELERCRRFAEPFSLVYLDVDGFKGVNDRHGHQRGDDLLRRIALALQQELRSLDMVARLGGDEFALLLPGTNTFGAGVVLTRLQAQLHRAAWRSQHGIDFSLGCLTVLTPPADVDSVVARADALMYEMKRDGNGRLRHEVLQAERLELPDGTPPPRSRRVAT